MSNWPAMSSTARNSFSSMDFRRNFTTVRKRDDDALIEQLLKDEKVFLVHLTSFRTCLTPLYTALSRFYMPPNSKQKAKGAIAYTPKTIINVVDQLVAASEALCDVLNSGKQKQQTDSKKLTNTQKICCFFNDYAACFHEYLQYWEWIQQAITHWYATVSDMRNQSKLAETIYYQNIQTDPLQIMEMLQIASFGSMDAYRNASQTSIFSNGNDDFLNQMFKFPMLRIHNYDKFLYQLIRIYTNARDIDHQIILQTRQNFASATMLLDKYETQISDLKELSKIFSTVSSSNLIKPHRQILKEGVVRVNKVEKYVIICNDIILVTKKSFKRDIAPTSECRVTLLNSSMTFSMEDDKISIHSQGWPVLLLSCESAVKTLSWFKVVQAAFDYVERQHFSLNHIHGCPTWLIEDVLQKSKLQRLLHHSQYGTPRSSPAQERAMFGQLLECTELQHQDVSFTKSVQRLDLQFKVINIADEITAKLRPPSEITSPRRKKKTMSRRTPRKDGKPSPRAKLERLSADLSPRCNSSSTPNIAATPPIAIPVPSTASSPSPLPSPLPSPSSPTPSVTIFDKDQAQWALREPNTMYHDENFSSLLRHSCGHQSFLNFLKSSFCEENLLFVEAVNRFKQSSNLQADAQHIYDTFVRREANMEVNLDFPVVNDIRQQIELNIVSADIFDKAANDIQSLLFNDSFPKYLKSKEFKEYQQTVEDMSTKEGKKKPRRIMFSLLRKPSALELKRKSKIQTKPTASPTPKIQLHQMAQSMNTPVMRSASKTAMDEEASTKDDITLRNGRRKEMMTIRRSRSFVAERTNDPDAPYTFDFKTVADL